jgi:hypothetical protein
LNQGVLSTSKKSWVSPSPEEVVGIVLVVLCVYRHHIELASGSFGFVFGSCHAGPAMGNLEYSTQNPKATRAPHNSVGG